MTASKFLRRLICWPMGHVFVLKQSRVYRGTVRVKGMSLVMPHRTLQLECACCGKTFDTTRRSITATGRCLTRIQVPGSRRNEDTFPLSIGEQHLVDALFSGTNG